MAYVEQYYYNFFDGARIEYEVSILEDGGTPGTINIEEASATRTVIIRSRGDKRVQLDNHILGSDFEFNFYIDETDISAWETVLESEYKKFKIEFYRNSVLKWVGWVQSDNYARAWIPQGGRVPIKLTATDGLANLKKIEFVNASTGFQYNDRVRLIETIKRALEHVGFTLDFRAQLGTYVTNGSPALMTSIQSVYDKVNCDNTRFTIIKEGRVVNENGYTLIEKVLKNFNCYLVQHDGLYWIINPQEKNSFYFPFPWTTLVVGTRTAHDLRLTIDSYDYGDPGEVNRIRPLEAVEVTARDRNVGDSLLTNGDFAIGNTAEWVNANWGVFLANPAGPNNELNTVWREIIDTPPSGSDPLSFRTLAKALVVRGDQDKLEVNFKVRAEEITMKTVLTGPAAPYDRIEINCRLRKGTPTGSIINSGFPFSIREDSGSVTKSYIFTIPEDDDYYVEFTATKVVPVWGDYSIVDLRWDDFYMSGVASETVDITLDSFYKVVNAEKNFTDVFEHETVFGDAVQDNDIGGFHVGVVRTDTWSRFGKSEDFEIQRLGAQNIIENFSKYKNYLRAFIRDPSDNIKPYTLVRIQSIDYQIVGHETTYAPGEDKVIRADLIEVLNTAVTTNIITQQLTSIDGGGDTNATIVTTVIVTGSGSGVTIHGQLSGLDQNDHPQYELDLGNPGTNGYVLASTTVGVRSWVNKEDQLGNPPTDGYLLSSTAAGIRSWVAPTGGSTTLAALTDTLITAVASGELLKWTGLDWENNTLDEANLVPKSGGTFTGAMTFSNASFLLSNIPNITSNHVLTYNAGSKAVQYHQLGLQEVTDVSGLTTGTISAANIGSTNLAGGDKLAYARSSDGQFLAVSLSTGLDLTAGVLSFDLALEDLNNTTITAIASGEILKWSGTAWINNTLAEAGIEPALGNPGTNGYVLSSTTAGVRSWVNKEDQLGNPSINGQVLSSTTAGVRSWITSPSKHTIENEGSGLTARTALDFIGGAVNVVDSAGNDASEVNVNPSILQYHQRDPFVTADIFYMPGNIAPSGTVLNLVAPFACTCEEYTYTFWMNTVTTSGTMTFTVVTNSGSQGATITVNALGFFKGINSITKLTIAKGDYIYVQASYTGGLAGTSSRGVVGVILKQS